MTAGKKLGGVWAAALTPVDADLQPDAPKAVAYYRDLLRDGCDGLNVLGTTGEAMSFGVVQRQRFMEALARSGLPLDRMMVGTGAASLNDAAHLTSQAFECGFAAALIMPPFFFRDAYDDGVLRFFDALFARATPPPSRVLLYNFPRMCGITLHPVLIDRLLEAFPGVIAGLKDSSNDVGLQTQTIERHGDLAVFPSSEAGLPAAKAYGAAGCISGSVCLWRQLARDVFARGDEAQAQTLSGLRATLSAMPLIGAVRHLTAKQRDDRTWERPMPPLAPLSKAQKAELDAMLAKAPTSNLR